MWDKKTKSILEILGWSFRISGSLGSQPARGWLSLVIQRPWEARRRDSKDLLGPTCGTLLPRNRLVTYMAPHGRVCPSSDCGHPSLSLPFGTNQRGHVWISEVNDGTGWMSLNTEEIEGEASLPLETLPQCCG